MIDQIELTCNQSEQATAVLFGKDIVFNNVDIELNIDELISSYEKIFSYYEKNNKISKITLFMHKDITQAMDNVKIDGKSINSKEDCEVVISYLKLKQNRVKCEKYWNELIGTHNAPKFNDLDKYYPENIANNWIGYIKLYLNWYNEKYEPLKSILDQIGLPFNTIFNIDDLLDSDIIVTEKILKASENDIPTICDVLIDIINISNCNKEIFNTQKALKSKSRITSSICKSLFQAIADNDIDSYAQEYDNLVELNGKYIVQRTRENLLDKLKIVAPQWENAIRNREGIHGKPTVPDNIYDAWKWKQLSAILDEISSLPYRQLQNESWILSKEYRKITALYAEKKAWYHLLLRTEGNLNIRQALQGWKQTIKKIGKGTGKNAPMYKKKAVELMGQCQNAVPCWIMPISRALENLDPKKNIFDVIIIDEASQSDISSLSILYMGKKLIIVGDDRQVSPMAIGVDIDRINSLQNTYINGKLPNAHLYDARTSIYDIAKTTFQPLMLREHFRCVPEIIGFSNILSYDGKIKPLRDASDSKLLPAVVNYRVKYGERLYNKTNPEEAKTIVGLIKSCIQQPEYKGKTFGVISLLGDEQAKYIQALIEKHIPSKEIFNRRIICGNASNFQGDERDVIFLSLVDSSKDTGTLRKQSNGTDDATKKRYNVAVSRARDQLWVVDSLDPSTDLKPDDLRKFLIDYSINPNAFKYREQEIQQKAESPFEEAVAKRLVLKGYNIVQQWEVGAYRLDLVAICGNKTIAIECDGERYHSGESKIREDMERQTILERLGWKFIRIRGSEYYRNPDKTIERVVSELSNYGINPEQNNRSIDNNSRETELISRVKSNLSLCMDDKVEDSFDIDDYIAHQNTKRFEAKFSKKEPEHVTESRRKNIKPVQEIKSKLNDNRYSNSNIKNETNFSRNSLPQDTKSEKTLQSNKKISKSQYDLSWGGPGESVRHNTYGIGTIISIEGNKINIKFNNDNSCKAFEYPQSIYKGYLKKL